MLLLSVCACADAQPDDATTDATHADDTDAGGAFDTQSASDTADTDPVADSDPGHLEPTDTDPPSPPFPAAVPCPAGTVRSGLTIHDATVVRWGALPGDALGSSLAVGDIDADGWPEVAVGAGMQWATDPVGAVFVLRPPWQTTWQAVDRTVDVLFGFEDLGGFGGRLEITDLDGDGRREVLVGARDDGTAGFKAGAVYRFDDADLRGGGLPEIVVRGAEPYHELGFGLALVPGSGGSASLVVSTPGWREPWNVGRPGALWRIDPPLVAPIVASSPVPGWHGPAYDAGLNAGFDAAAVGDQDGDGVTDLLVGGFGRAWLVSGADVGDPAGEAVLATFVAPDDFDEEALFVDGGRDLNGDSRPDLVLGSIGNTPEPCESLDPDECSSPEHQWQRGVVWVFLRAVGGDVDLATADVQIEGHSIADETGLTFASVEDLDRDGSDELLVSHYGEAAAHVHRFSGLSALGTIDIEDGALLTEMDERANAIVVADVTGDGRADLLLGEGLSGTGGAHAGRVQVLELCPAIP